MTYYAAFKARDFNALRAIFPTASENDRARIEALRKDYEPCDYELRGLEVNSLTATRAFVRVHVTETCRPRIRTSPRQIEGSKAFELGKTSDGRWVVTTGG
jgi:hypothetical protein